MNLSTACAESLSNAQHLQISPEQLIACLDLTLLDEQAGQAEIIELQTKAETAHVAAICVYPKHIQWLRPLNTVKLATVINFPHGKDSIALSAEQIHAAKELGASEIDYVFAYTSYLAGNQARSLDTYAAIATLCFEQKLSLKTILETGAFNDLDILYTLSCEVCKLGGEFLKTSTGKTAQGASLPAVFTLLKAIRASQKDIGLKVSGGVRTPQQALEYAQLASFVLDREIDSNWFRIGASSLLDALLV